MKTLDEYKIYLDISKEREGMKIKYPLYQNCYANALEALWNNFQHNKNAKDIPQGMISSIIAFMGGRGSGKTTALCEFNRILKNYKAYKVECGNVLFPDNQLQEYDGWFHVLKSIDASLLEKDEDIIELIWANMYKDFRKANERERQSERLEYHGDLANRIVEEFDDVYKDYKRPRENRAILGDTVLTKLKHLSSSLKTKEACDSLIGDFLEYMQFKMERKKGNAFLVVTVDDLDLNIESGYRILEDLYRYLNNPRVIVLIAADFSQMKALCNTYFTKGIHIEDSSDAFSNISHAEKLTNDFLVKVLPLANRIYMPDKKNILKEATVISANRIGDMKQFILGKTAEKMGIYYDGAGLKWHFCVPQRMRELIQRNEFLEMLYDTNDIADNEETKMRLYDANHERFNRDINENMAPRILNSEQQKIFGLILERNIERRAKYAVNFLNNKRGVLAGQRDRKKLLDMVDDQEYYYSDLLEIIYKLGRLNYDDKALLHCVLASFTSEMTREYYSYVHNPDERTRIRAAERLESFLGNTFGGRWFYKIGPKVESKEGAYFKLHCAARGKINSNGYSDRMVINEDSNISYVESIAYLVPVLECIFLLFPNCYDEDGNKIEPMWKIAMNWGSGEEKDACSITVKAESSQADFDVLGFVGKEIDTADNLKFRRLTDRIIESLVRNVLDFEERKGRQAENKDRDIWRDFLRSKSIWKEEEGYKAYFPFYNLDMTYNVIKRVRRKLNEAAPIKSNEILQYFQRAYGYIAFELHREDEFYKAIDEHISEERPGSTFVHVASHFMDDFVNCPYIKAMGYQYYDGREETRLQKEATINVNVFNNLMYSILSDFVKDDNDSMNSMASMQ